MHLFTNKCYSVLSGANLVPTVPYNYLDFGMGFLGSGTDFRGGGGSETRSAGKREDVRETNV